MSTAAKITMSAAEFLLWAEGQEGRWELHDGAVVAMSRERLSHVRTKGLAFQALAAAISRARLPCQAFSDGVSVRVEDGSVYEPDAVVHRGPRLPEDAIGVPNPVVVVEVVSPSTAARDHGVKLAGYFSLPGLAHYLILDPERRVVIHHKRGGGDVIENAQLVLRNLAAPPAEPRSACRGHVRAAAASHPLAVRACSPGRSHDNWRRLHPSLG